MNNIIEMLSLYPKMKQWNSNMFQKWTKIIVHIDKNETNERK